MDIKGILNVLFKYYLEKVYYLFDYESDKSESTESLNQKFLDRIERTRNIAQNYITVEMKSHMKSHEYFWL